MSKPKGPAPVDFDRLGDLMGESYGAPAPEVPGRGPSGRRARPNAPPPRTSETDPSRQLAMIWAEVVGAEVAANSRPLQLNRGRLVASASSSEWAQTLQFMSEAIIARLNERLGPGVVGRAVFRHAGWEERRQPKPGAVPAPCNEAAPRPAAALSQEQKAAIAQVEQLGLASELEEKIIRAMMAAFVRGQQDSVR